MRALSRRELNRALLARQLLLERARLPPARALERIGGIQAQYAPSMYVGLWSRLEGFERTALTRALERRTVVQGTLLRSTIHLVSPPDFWLFADAVRQARRESWLRARPGGPQAAEMAAAAAALRAALGGGVLSRREIEALVGRPAAAGVGLWVDLVRVPPAGTWERRRADLYAAADAWLGPPRPAGDAAEHLVRRYLRGFGPASRADVASFTGLRPAALDPVLARMTLRRFRAAETGEELLDLPRAPLPPAPTPAPPRFLPTWDATLLVHARRTGILPEEHRARIFSARNPHSLPTFLLDGEVAGAWRFEDGAVRLEPFAPLARAEGAALGAEAEALARLYA
jgi:Winged helix DNA-binding domain